LGQETKCNSRPSLISGDLAEFEIIGHGF
jgi:hypothetical protein